MRRREGVNVVVRVVVIGGGTTSKRGGGRGRGGKKEANVSRLLTLSVAFALALLCLQHHVCVVCVVVRLFHHQKYKFEIERSEKRGSEDDREEEEGERLIARSRGGGGDGGGRIGGHCSRGACRV
jgi:hypothetical protein